MDSEMRKVPAEVFRLLQAKKMKMASCESCTGGLIAKLMTDIPGSSEVFEGACVTYTCEAKHTLVGVDPALIESCGVVSEPVALEMARGVRRVLGTDFGVSTTGIAGPGGGTDSQPVGTVCIALSGADIEVTDTLRLPADLGREGIREAAAVAVLRLLLTYLG